LHEQEPEFNSLYCKERTFIKCMTFYQKMNSEQRMWCFWTQASLMPTLYVCIINTCKHYKNLIIKFQGYTYKLQRTTWSAREFQTIKIKSESIYTKIAFIY
jgi:hypothetical protein